MMMQSPFIYTDAGRSKGDLFDDGYKTINQKSNRSIEFPDDIPNQKFKEWKKNPNDVNLSRDALSPVYDFKGKNFQIGLGLKNI